jgi:hypothetical protein
MNATNPTAHAHSALTLRIHFPLGLPSKSTPLPFNTLNSPCFKPKFCVVYSVASLIVQNPAGFFASVSVNPHPGGTKLPAKLLISFPFYLLKGNSEIFYESTVSSLDVFAPAIIEWKSLLKLAYPPKKSSSSQFYVSEKNRECAGSFYVLATLRLL